ncbi:MAG: chemotaxis protein CheX [Planctomycetota bacterium]
MDPRYISPFVSSVQNVFSTMLQLPVTVGEPRLKERGAASHDVTAIIGMSGDVVGSVALSFPADTAHHIVALFSGMDLDRDHPDFADAVGELANMICGGAKAQFPSDGRASISVPSVVLGKGHSVSQQSNVPCVVIPCDTDCGDLVIEVAIRQSQETENPTTAGAAQA